MISLYADYVCPNCNEEDKQIIDLISIDKDKIIFPGDRLEHQEVNKEIECFVCNEFSNATVKILNDKFVGFYNQKQLEEEKVFRVPDKFEAMNKWKTEKTFFPSLRIDFKNQPFAVGEKINIENKELSICGIYRMEWIEKDIDKRLEHPRPDVYWYKMIEESGKVMWMKVENVEGDNVYISNTGIILTDQYDKIEDITESPTKINKVFESDWFGGRELEVFQYINGVRALVYDHKKQIEIDLFEDTFEEVMNAIEENTEMGIFNE